MQTTTTPTPVEMPVVHSPLDPEVADKLGDDVVLAAVAETKVDKVPRTPGSDPSVDPRAWTFGGGVD